MADSEDEFDFEDEENEQDDEDLDIDEENEQDQENEEDNEDEEDNEEDDESDEEEALEQLEKKTEELDKIIKKIQDAPHVLLKLKYLPKAIKLASEIGPSAVTQIKQLKKKIEEEQRLNLELQKLKPIASTCSFGQIFKGFIIVAKAKKFKTLKVDALAVLAMLNANLVGKIAKYAKIILYVLLGVAAIGLIILIVVAIAAFFDSIFGGGGSSGDTGTSQFGVTGKDFYAVRTLYKDDEQAKNDIVEDYVGYISSSVDKAKTTIETNPDYTLTITIEIPTENIAQNVLDETKTEYAALRGVFSNMVETAYLHDNPEGPINALSDRVNAIKYMGIDEYLQTQFKTIVADGICPYFYVEDKEHTPIDVTTTIQESASYVLDNAKVGRTAKLYIKDYVLNGEEDRMKDIAKEQYVAAIFLPRRNLTFTQLYVAVWNTDRATFEMHIANASTTYEFSNVYEVDADVYPGKFCYETSSSFNVAVSQYVAGLQVEEGERSLLKIVKQAESGASYLEQKTDETTSLTYYTFKLDGMRLEFASEQAFNFVEVETKVS